jgi:hypothetical protein
VSGPAKILLYALGKKRHNEFTNASVNIDYINDKPRVRLNVAKNLDGQLQEYRQALARRFGCERIGPRAFLRQERVYREPHLPGQLVHYFSLR